MALIAYFVIGYGGNRSLSVEVSRGVDVLVAIDISKSGGEKGLYSAFIGDFAALLGEEDRIGIVTFHSTGNLFVPLRSIGSDRDLSSLISSVNGIDFWSHHSNINSGLERALKELKAHDRPETNKCVILLSNGGSLYLPDNISRDKTITNFRSSLLPDFLLNEITVYPISFVDNSDSTLLQEIAYLTNGDHYLVNSKESLVGTVSSIYSSLYNETQRKKIFDKPIAPPLEPDISPEGVSDEDAYDFLIPKEEAESKGKTYWWFGVGIIILIVLSALIYYFIFRAGLRGKVKVEIPTSNELKDESTIYQEFMDDMGRGDKSQNKS